MTRNQPASAISVSSLWPSRRATPDFPKVGAEEERELSRRFRAGDRRAGDRLIQACLPFVVTIAREYRRWGVPMEDVVQQGNLGLLKAAARFDPDRGCRLVTYAAYWIRAEIREHVVRSYRMVRLGTTKSERRALRTYRRTRETDPDRLAQLAGVSCQAAERLIPSVSARDASVDQSNGSGISLLDRIASSEPTPEERAIAEEARAKTRVEVETFLREISARERAIFQARLLSEEPFTLECLARRFGISKERVRQLEERTIDRLRSRLLACPGLAEAC